MPNLLASQTPNLNKKPATKTCLVAGYALNLESHYLVKGIKPIYLAFLIAFASIF
jgi:hypothetical protein